MILRVIGLVWEHFIIIGQGGRKERKEGRGRGRKGEGRGEGRGREEGRRDLLGRRNWKGGIFFWVDICVSWDIIALGKS